MRHAVDGLGGSSCPHVSAIRGTIDVAAISRDLGDDDLVALSRRVTITECDDCNARFPAERWASATLHLRDGRRIQSPAMEARGNPHNPLSDDEIAAKFQALASPVLGARAEDIEEVVVTLETRPIGDLLRLLA